jgi:hypothetical protein
MPITRHLLKTVVTHIREVEASDEQELRALYERDKKRWIEESFDVVNRLIDAYSLAALDDKTRGEAGRVAFWDVGLILVSFWDESGSHQLGGHMQAVRPDTPPPHPFDADRQLIFEGLVGMEDEPPLPRLLSVTAWGHIQRGNYRAAIVDDFNAIELAVSKFANDLARKRNLPAEEVEGLLRRLKLEDVCRDLLPVMGGPKLTDWDKWSRVKKAQEIRNRVVHRGVHATRSDASVVHDAALWTLTWLIASTAELESPSAEQSGPDGASIELPD